MCISAHVNFKNINSKTLWHCLYPPAHLSSLPFCKSKFSASAEGSHMDCSFLPNIPASAHVLNSPWFIRLRLELILILVQIVFLKNLLLRNTFIPLFPSQEDMAVQGKACQVQKAKIYLEIKTIFCTQCEYKNLKSRY